MELLLWLEQIEIWRIERDHTSPKEDTGESEDTELPEARYPEKMSQ